MTAYVCPDCGAARQRDGRPGCACAAREAAAAEDFDPLRIRPYVELREPAPAPGPEQPPAPGPAAPHGAGASAPDAAGGPAPRSAAAPDSPVEGSPGEDSAAAREPDGAPDRSAGGASGPETSAASAAPSASSPESGPGPVAVPGSGTGWDTLFRSPPADPAPGNAGGPDGTGGPAGAGPPGDGPGTGRSAPGSAASAGTAAEQHAGPAAPTTALPRFDATGRPAGPDRPGDSGAGPGGAPETGGPAGEDDAPDTTRPLSPLTPAAGAAGAAQGGDSHPRAEDLGLFHDDAFADRDPEDSGRPGPGHTGRRRRTAVIAGAAAAVVVVCAGVLGTGLLGGDKEDRAAPDENSLTPTAVLPTDGNGPSASTSASPSASVSANGGSPSASATGSSPSASPSGTAGPAAPDGTPEPTRASGSVSDAPDEPGDGSGSGSGQDDPPVLQKGMSGPEVLEMQQRLNQVGLFSTVDEDGSYDEQDERAIANYQRWNGVEGDPSGVYGPATRRSLEERTEEP